MASFLDNLQADINIPLADDDPQVIINDDDNDDTSSYSMAGMSGSPEPPSDDTDDVVGPSEKEDKARLISQVLELQNTLDDIAQRMDDVKVENLKLRSENQVLGQYIENLMSASSVFQSTSNPNVVKKK